MGVQLFPFLAVLICTFGVLIVLLVLVVKQADVHASEVQEEMKDEAEQQLTALETRRDLLLVRNEAFESGRTKYRSQLSDARNRRSYLLESLRELEQQRRLTAAEYSKLQSQELGPPLGDQISVAEQQLERLKNELQLARAEQSVAQPTTYSIVPYKGHGGTNRRPIYVECRPDGIFFQPGQIHLKRSDFADVLTAGNPLDEAFLAVRDYWNRNELAGKEGDPYPLIVVRPGGVEMYSLVRHAIKSWDDEFGYELVTAEMEIDFGLPDPNLNEEIEKAIVEARKRQRSIRWAQAQRGDGISNRPGFRASSQWGGFVDDRGRPAGIGRSAQNKGEPRTESKVARAENARVNRGVRQGISVESTELADGQLKRGLNGSSAEAGAQAAEGGNAPAAVSNSGSVQSLAESQGADWALPTKTPGAIGYVRPVSLDCFPDRLVLRHRESTGLKIDGATQTVVTSLVNHVWKIVESWGVAGAGSYWKPELRVRVQPGGEQRFADLKKLLEGSGLRVERAVERKRR